MEDAFEELKRFGLTNYEIMVFRAIATKGPLTTGETVKLSGIPQPRVYDVIAKLTERGLIEMSPGKKNLYRAKSVSEAFSQHLEEMKKTVSKIDRQVEKLKSSRTSDDPYFWIVKSENKIKKELKNMIRNTEDEILLSLKRDNFNYVKDDLVDAVNEGINVGLVLFPEEGEIPEILLKKANIMRRWGRASEVFIKDRSEIVVKIDNGRKDDNYAIVAREDEIIHIASYYFYHTIWMPGDTLNISRDRGELRFKTAWYACWFLKNLDLTNLNVKCKVTGIYKNRLRKLEGDVTNVTVKEGYQHTFNILYRGSEIRIGGKTARIEDVAMHGCEFAWK
ncbi:TrmB family transcriptional regulator [Caldiplasma sukawensis]